MSRANLALACAAVLLPTMAAYAAGSIVVDQLHRNFSVREIHVGRGDTVRFHNVDEFLHQIYVDSPTFKYSSNEQSPGQTVGVTFPTKGTFEVRCEIHPKMLMSVIVE